MHCKLSTGTGYQYVWYCSALVYAGRWCLSCFYRAYVSVLLLAEWTADCRAPSSTQLSDLGRGAAYEAFFCDNPLVVLHVQAAAGWVSATIPRHNHAPLAAPP